MSLLFFPGAKIRYQSKKKTIWDYEGLAIFDEAIVCHFIGEYNVQRVKCPWGNGCIGPWRKNMSSICKVLVNMNLRIFVWLLATSYEVVLALNKKRRMNI